METHQGREFRIDVDGLSHPQATNTVYISRTLVKRLPLLSSQLHPFFITNIMKVYYVLCNIIKDALQSYF